MHVENISNGSDQILGEICAIMMSRWGLSVCALVPLHWELIIFSFYETCF